MKQDRLSRRAAAGPTGGGERDAVDAVGAPDGTAPTGTACSADRASERGTSATHDGTGSPGHATVAPGVTGASATPHATASRDATATPATVPGPPAAAQVPTAVPMVDLPRGHAPLLPELTRAFERVVRSGQFILGDEVAAFESEIESALGVEHAIAVSSGSDALLLALQALGIGPGDDVLCPAFTFFATAGSVWRAGARPVFTDVSSATFNAERDELEARITPSTRALIVVHLFGRLAEMAPILDLARRRDLLVIEDAAQAIGARAAGRSAGAFGAAGCFSFFPTKNLGALGDGGMVTTASADLAGRLRVLRHQGQSGRYVHDQVGGAFRLDALQAALLRVKLPHVPRWNASRREIAARYDALFTSRGLARGAVAERSTGDAPDGDAAVVLPRPVGEAHVFHQYVIRVRSGARDTLREHLDRAGITTQIYYPVPLHLQPCFAELGGRVGELPVAERLAAEVLALPIHPDLAPEAQERVVEAIAAFFAAGAKLGHL